MENPNNWSMEGLDDDFILPYDEDVSISGRPKSKSHRNKNAKQLTWVLLLKADKAASCLTSIVAALLSISSAVRRRVASGRTNTEDLENSMVRRRFYSCIKVFLWLAALLLGFEVAAYFKGWHFGTPDLQLQYLYTLTRPLAVKDAFDSIWLLIRVDYLVPPLSTIASGG